MNQEPTPSEQEIVNKESKKKSFAYDYSDHRTTYKEGFQEGVEFAIRELFKGRVVGFAEWVGEQFEHNIFEAPGYWRQYGTPDWITTEQLYSKYMDYLKQKESNSTE